MFIVMLDGDGLMVVVVFSAVVMVGLPYPNPNDTELKERMSYLNQTIGPKAGAIYYQNICMRAVNQSIGRAIRHKMDYGAIILMVWI